jgi:uncharacterized membrane protein
LIAASSRHLRHHGRFYLSALLGIALWKGLEATGFAHPLVAAGDAFFATYLLSTALLVTGTPEAMRRRATYEDEGIGLIFILTVAAMVSSLVAIFGLIGKEGATAVELALAIANVVLGWTTFNTIAAFHYGHRYYTGAGPAHARRDTGGLAFPETKTPHITDFLYFAFTIGMTAQTSDVDITSTAMRRLALAHSVVAFFYNTLVIALAVNVAAGLAK